MNLSNNLTLKEAIRSYTAERAGIDNTPSDEVINNLKICAERVFQPIRDNFNVPIAVTSGYRSEELNRLIRGAKNSDHLRGQALDLDADVLGGVSNSEIFYYVLYNIPFSKLIWENGDEKNPSWVHISYIEDNLAGDVYIAKPVNGRMFYHKWMKVHNQFNKLFN